MTFKFISCTRTLIIYYSKYHKRGVKNIKRKGNNTENSVNVYHYLFVQLMPPKNVQNWLVPSVQIEEEKETGLYAWRFSSNKP